ncbi:hypothetical protein [Hymenobacter negativus]|uniref:Outer membrane protein beta-barrel domain-containing protein n=1 Tax=Hymenobacter negativus TaxID=2795026 RepID=A0ABS3QBU1_9BACT|nr:hypothetical protein [Hymenobacter negativus]MBO2008720.1 hypothetical protein [Hymenobacter negativus]
MSVNPIDENSTPKTTGSLEELFRHHLGEEAVAPTRPMLWDQIDNSLLIRQNEIYRRRLVATRWVAAASLLLATMAGTGWWVGRHELLRGTGMASNSQSAASGTRSDNGSLPATSGNTRTTLGLEGSTGQRHASVATSSMATDMASSNTLGTATARNGIINAGGSPSSGYTANRANQATAKQGRYTSFGTASSSARYSTNGLATAASSAAQGSNMPASYAAASGANTASTRETQSNSPTSTANPTLDVNTSNMANSRALAATEAAGVTAAGTKAAIGSGTASDVDASTVALAPTVAAAIAPEEMSLLAARQSSLTLAVATSLPNGLATVPVDDIPAVDVHRWRYSASYAAGVFNPNVNFSRAGIEPEFDYNRGPAFGADSPTLTEAAATEYRNNLRPGLSQRIALMATRHLRGHWSLSTGAEFTRATAQSASSSAFVGEQLFDLSQGNTAQPLRTTDFRYQLASIPLEVRYSNPVKRGWSIYGRLGGVVTALLGVRSDVQGDPEATRTYSITSTGGPYRRLMGSVRGGAGAQFRPSTSKWAFSMGPTADLGLVALNAHPVQNYFAQSHPYSVGLEAAVEFGR